MNTLIVPSPIIKRLSSNSISFEIYSSAREELSEGAIALFETAIEDFSRIELAEKIAFSGGSAGFDFESQEYDITKDEACRAVSLALAVLSTF